MDNPLDIIVLVGLIFAFLVIVLVIMMSLYRRASKEIAFVRTGVGGEKVVMNGGAVVVPVLQRPRFLPLILRHSTSCMSASHVVVMSQMHCAGPAL